MCLNKVTKVYDGKDKKERSAWKVFHVDDKRDYHFEFRTIKGRCHRGLKSSLVPTGKWLKAVGKDIACSEGSRYPAGFHCFKERNAARHFAGGSQRVVKVTGRRLLAKGDQGFLEYVTLVFKEIYVPKIKKGRR